MASALGPTPSPSWPAHRSLPFAAARELRRRWRRLLRRWSRRGVFFVYDSSYSWGSVGLHLDPLRGERVLAFLAEEGLLQSDDVSVARPASLRALLRVHSEEYLETLSRPEVALRIFGLQLGDAEVERVLRTQRLMVGGTIQSTRLVLAHGGVAVNLGGGFHHAEGQRGQAFCMVNDVAVAVARLRAQGFRAPVLVVDLDLHDGNGTRAVFADDPTVHTFSIHAEHWGDTEAVASTSIALGSGVTDEVYLGTLLKTLPDVVESFAPGLVVYVAGTDPAADDALGNWRITDHGMLSRDRFVFGLFRHRRHPLPMVVVLGGGYGEGAWRYTARMAAWLLSRRVVEPPDNDELTLMRYRRLWQGLGPGNLTTDAGGPFSFSLSEEDLQGIVPGSPRQTKLLGYFSQHGVELVLERLGLLDQLRLRGYQQPVVELDLDHPQGQTLRIFGGHDRKELLVELRVDRSRRVAPELDMLVIEWLLLQDPRAEFGPSHRPLPGQQHPGLGLLREVAGWLVVVGEKLGLDGISYTPSHYHVAAQSRRFVRFLKPEDEARFRCLEKLLAGHSLAEASRLVAGGQVVDATSGKPLEWKGFPMVLPVSERLKGELGAEYEAAVQRELARYELRLVEPSATAHERAAP